jgi:hypothetical protein
MRGSAVAPFLALTMAVCAFAFTSQALAQEEPLPVSIEASPPLNRSSIDARGLRVRDGKAEFTSMPLADLVCAAYKIGPHQLNGPVWMKAQFWNIQVSVQGSNATASELLRAVLEVFSRTRTRGVKV